MYEEYLYKKELLDTFGKDGELVDNVKLQLRHKIISKLKQNPSQNKIFAQQSLVKKVCITLIANYLQSERYFHSLSVFSPESSFTKNHFTNDQMMSMFNVNRQADESILQSVIKQTMPRGRMIEKKIDSCVQTDNHESIMQLQTKLSALDFSYKQKMLQGLKSVEDSEQRFLKYKNQLNKRYKDDLQAEIVRIRNFEIANIRMQQQQKARLKSRQIQEELQNSYRSKMQKLRERQAEVIQRVTTKMKEVQSYNYQARQKIIKDMQNVRAQQEELDRMKQQLEAQQRQLKFRKN